MCVIIEKSLRFGGDIKYTFAIQYRVTGSSDNFTYSGSDFASFEHLHQTWNYILYLRTIYLKKFFFYFYCNLNEFSWNVLHAETCCCNKYCHGSLTLYPGRRHKDIFKFFFAFGRRRLAKVSNEPTQACRTSFSSFLTTSSGLPMIFCRIAISVSLLLTRSMITFVWPPMFRAGGGLGAGGNPFRGKRETRISHFEIGKGRASKT